MLVNNETRAFGGGAARVIHIVIINIERFCR